MYILKKNWPLFVVGSFAAVLLLASCATLQPLAPKIDPTPLPPVIQAGGVDVEGRLVPVRSSTLGFASGGEIGELPVSEGQQVNQGAVLARLNKREPLEAALSQANLDLLTAQQTLDKLNDTADLTRRQVSQELAEARRALSEARKAFNDLDTDDFRTDLDDRRIAVQDRLEELEDAQEELDKYTDLDPDNATRKNAQTALDDAQRAYDDALYDQEILQNEIDQAQAVLDLADSRVEDAQRRVDARQDGPDPDELALASARISSAEAQVAASQRALDNFELIAPYASTVVDLHDLEPGESVNPNMPVVTLADFSAWIVETRDLTELDVIDVEVGQTVEVTPDALPDLDLSGVVESISSTFTERSGDILYTVRIRLDTNDPRLRWGMTVTVTFQD